MIYRYIGADSAEEAIKILKYFIEDGSIRASDPRTFNDPSEFKVIYDFKADNDVIKERYYLDNPNSSQQDFETWFSRFDEHKKWYTGYSTLQHILDTVGVICFSIDPDNYLMWSHYTKNHTGFCVGFDENILDSFDDFECFGQVNYSHSVPVFNYFTQNKNEFYKAIFLNKSLNWEYEREFRIITRGNGNKHFDCSLVKEIIIGCKSPDRLDKFVRNLIGSGIMISQMINLPKEYRLLKVPIERDKFCEKSAL